MYRQAISDLSLEEGTPRVANDGHYYVILRGQIIGRFRSLAKAQAKFGDLKKTLHLKPTKSPPPSPTDMLQREMETMSNKELIWTEEDFIRVERKTRGKRGTRSAG